MIIDSERIPKNPWLKAARNEIYPLIIFSIKCFKDANDNFEKKNENIKRTNFILAAFSHGFPGILSESVINAVESEPDDDNSHSDSDDDNIYSKPKKAKKSFSKKSKKSSSNSKHTSHYSSIKKVTQNSKSKASLENKLNTNFDTFSSNSNLEKFSQNSEINKEPIKILSFTIPNVNSVINPE